MTAAAVFLWCLAFDVACVVGAAHLIVWLAG